VEKSYATQVALRFSPGDGLVVIHLVALQSGSTIWRR
jgi:hypothetical protein